MKMTERRNKTGQEKTGEKSRADLTSAIAAYLTCEGVPPNRKGYVYLAYAIEIVYKDRELTGALSKAVYPAVAGRFATSPAAVERAIRTALACAGKRENKSTDTDAGSRTNSAFIFGAAEHIRTVSGA